MGDRLRADWDFDDLEGTEHRFRQLLTTETSDSRRAEILTQLARVQGLRGDFAGGERLLEEAEQLVPAERGAPRVRIDLERGRLRRSSGDAEAALPLFESAFEAAADADEAFLAPDAAHMAALVASDRAGFVAWTERGVELAESEEDARYWLGPLLNNLGWELFEAGEHEAALAAFECALEARKQDPENRAAIEIARYAVAKTLRALERPAEAAGSSSNRSGGRRRKRVPTAGSTRSWRRAMPRSGARRKRRTKLDAHWRFCAGQTPPSSPTARALPG